MMQINVRHTPTEKKRTEAVSSSMQDMGSMLMVKKHLSQFGFQLYYLIVYLNTLDRGSTLLVEKTR